MNSYKNPYRETYQGFFIKRLRGSDDRALGELLEREQRGTDPAGFRAGAETVVGIYDCRGYGTKLALFPEDAPLAAAGVIREDGSVECIVPKAYRTCAEDLQLEKVLSFVMERQLWQNRRRPDLPTDEEAFCTDEAQRARAVRGLTAIIATHDFVENPGTRYED